jgi:hypothetical protein
MRGGTHFPSVQNRVEAVRDRHQSEPTAVLDNSDFDRLGPLQSALRALHAADPGEPIDRFERV